ncbi:integrase core domain-containing protein, partial [Lactiplantibacillus plantarum]
LHIRHSYSRKGCPYDNAPMESFHASLKKECVYPVPVFEDYETAAAVLFEYVHAFYNRKRIHSSLGYHTTLTNHNLDNSMFHLKAKPYN